MILSAFLGFVMGLRHALEPDHLATVATMGTHYKRHLAIGLLWSTGHSAIIVVVAVLLDFTGFNLSKILPAFLSWDVLVGVAMIAMGVLIFRPYHVHAHMHHSDFHFHVGINHHHLPKKPFAFGVLHGLSGSAPIILLFANNLSFVFIWCGGVIISMFLLTLLIGRIVPRLNIDALKHVVSGISIGVGVMLILLNYHLLS